MDAVGIVLWAGAAGGAVAVAVAAATPSHRRIALLVAAGLFLPIGVLGILSVGVVFLAAALACAVGAAVSRHGAPRAGSPPDS